MMMMMMMMMKRNELDQPIPNPPLYIPFSSIRIPRRRTRQCSLPIINSSAAILTRKK
jgi:hypothetical protein